MLSRLHGNDGDVHLSVRETRTYSATDAAPQEKSEITRHLQQFLPKLRNLDHGVRVTIKNLAQLT